MAAIEENPAAPGIGANLHSGLLTIGEEFHEGSQQFGSLPVPVAAGGREVNNVTAIFPNSHTPIQGNLKPLVDPREICLGHVFPRGHRFGHPPKENAQALYLADTAATANSGPNVPKAEEDANPTRIVEMFGDVPVAVVLFAVDQIKPGVALTESFC